MRSSLTEYLRIIKVTEYRIEGLRRVTDSLFWVVMYKRGYDFSKGTCKMKIEILKIYVMIKPVLRVKDNILSES